MGFSINFKKGFKWIGKQAKKAAVPVARAALAYNTGGASLAIEAALRATPLGKGSSPRVSGGGSSWLKGPMRSVGRAVTSASKSVDALIAGQGSPIGSTPILAGSPRAGPMGGSAAVPLGIAAIAAAMFLL